MTEKQSLRRLCRHLPLHKGGFQKTETSSEGLIKNRNLWQAPPVGRLFVISDTAFELPFLGGFFIGLKPAAITREL